MFLMIFEKLVINHSRNVEVLLPFVGLLLALVLERFDWEKYVVFYLSFMAWGRFVMV